MKRFIALLLVVACMGSALCFAEEKPTDTLGEFLGNLSATWDSLVKLAGEAGESVTVWANQAAEEIGKWMQNADIDIDMFIQENSAAIEQWLKTAGEEVNKAWDVVTHNSEHTQEEIRDALKTIEQSLEEISDKAQ